MIGSFSIHRDSVELRATINIMSYNMCKKVGLGEPTPNRMTVSFAKKSLRHPRGAAKDFLVNVKELVFQLTSIF